MVSSASYIEQVRRWSYRNNRELWSLWHELKHRVNNSELPVPIHSNRKASVGKMLVAAMLEIIELRKKQGE